MTTSYRPRNPGHDYYGKGIYLITLVVSHRAPLPGRLGNDVKCPRRETKATNRFGWSLKTRFFGNILAIFSLKC